MLCAISMNAEFFEQKTRLHEKMKFNPKSKHDVRKFKIFEAKALTTENMAWENTSPWNRSVLDCMPCEIWDCSLEENSDNFSSRKLVQKLKPRNLISLIVRRTPAS